MSAGSAVTAVITSAADVLPLREQYRQEMNCQIVHDSIHRRARLDDDVSPRRGRRAAGSVRWLSADRGRTSRRSSSSTCCPSIASRAFDLFEALLAASGARFMEIQSNDLLLSVMLHTYARDISSDKIVFHDRLTTALPADGCGPALLRRPRKTSARCIDERQGGPEWTLELDGATAATGGILFHYNRPYGDIYMDVAEPTGGRGLGSYLVQELKRSPTSSAASLRALQSGEHRLAKDAAEGRASCRARTSSTARLPAPDSYWLSAKRLNASTWRRCARLIDHRPNHPSR